mmetsp:Transcript_13996/g.39789  ORF Transcript_13996/g.39789 Transcript_13996/m.39789 type:complete len:197 (+) Transcript_13996:39-629(+)
MNEQEVQELAVGEESGVAVAGVDCPPLVEFTVQAAVGMHMGLFRATGGGLGEMTPQQQNMKQAMLANYINNCWASLIRGDDDYVLNTFNAIHDILSTESPLCIMHRVFHVGSLLLSVNLWESLCENVGVHFAAEHQNKDHGPWVDAIRNFLRVSLEPIASDILSKSFDDGHHCEGPKLENITEEDPLQPIFNLQHA